MEKSLIMLFAGLLLSMLISACDNTAVDNIKQGNTKYT